MLDGLHTRVAQINGPFGEKNQYISSFWLPDDSEFTVVLARRGRQSLAFPNEASAVDRRRVPRAPQPPQVQVLLKRAYELKEKLDGTPGLTRDALAKAEGIDPSRLTRILNLLNLAPEIQQHVLALPPSIRRGLLTERRLRPIAKIADPREQVARFQELLRQPVRTRKTSQALTSLPPQLPSAHLSA